jgi:hypothetical protein
MMTSSTKKELSHVPLNTPKPVVFPLIVNASVLTDPIVYDLPSSCDIPEMPLKTTLSPTENLWPGMVTCPGSLSEIAVGIPSTLPTVARGLGRWQ